MTKSEFLKCLKNTLANELQGQQIQENVNYYSEYISDEVRKGRSESEVIDELGDPWAIAKSIIESEEIKSGTQEEYTYEPKGYNQEQQSSGRRVHVFGLNWWKMLLLILGIIGSLMIIVAVIGGIFSLLAPILVPLLVIIFVIRVLGNRRR